MPTSMLRAGLILQPIHSIVGAQVVIGGACLQRKGEEDVQGWTFDVDARSISRGVLGVRGRRRRPTAVHSGTHLAAAT